MIIVLVILGFIWFSCGILSASYRYNYFQSEWPEIAEEDERKDFIEAIHRIPLGIIDLLTTFSFKQQVYGPRFRRYKYINGIRQV